MSYNIVEKIVTAAILVIYSIFLIYAGYSFGSFKNDGPIIYRYNPNCSCSHEDRLND